MGRSYGVGMTKFQMTKADLHNEVHFCCPQPAPATSYVAAAAQAAPGPLLVSGLDGLTQNPVLCDEQV